MRRPRFRRASEPLAFRLTDADIEIVRHVARHRFLRSTHIAALVGRSLDRTNDRLQRLFHAGYIDRPRAQLDYYPCSGSAPFVYALADRGARLLRDHDGIAFANPECSRKNRRAGRPFIEHQIEIAEFRVALQGSVAQRSDIRLISPEEMNPSASRQQMLKGSASFSFRAKLTHHGKLREISVVPDFVFGLRLANGERRNYVVEIDRGTMPITRSDIDQTSVERKLRVYLAAHAAKQHQLRYRWKNFRVLVLTTSDDRQHSMIEASRRLTSGIGKNPVLFLFKRTELLTLADPLDAAWFDGAGREEVLL